MRARRCRWHSGGAWLPPGSRHLQVGLPSATEVAAMKLQPIEQACDCSTVRDRGGLKVRARLCRWHSRGACLPPGTRHLQVVSVPDAMEAAAMMMLRLIEQACGCSTMHDARRGRTQGACSSLPLALL